MVVVDWKGLCQEGLFNDRTSGDIVRNLPGSGFTVRPERPELGSSM